ncbi:MAG: hypothetical protein K1Y01_00600 [Vicinamibacteria bacterium]|nr:hypothetical protein [Vicinamibacteria bacterium]
MKRTEDSLWTRGLRELAETAVFSLFLLLAGSNPARAMLVRPQLHALFVTGETVIVRVGDRLIEFDREGRFVRYRPVADPKGIESAQAVGGDANLLWFVSRSLKKSFEVEATRLFSLDGTGAVAREVWLEGDRSVRVAGDGSIFVGRVAGKELVIERFDPAAATLSSWRSVMLDRTWRDLDMSAAPAFDWVVLPGGDLAVLSTRGDSGRVTRLGPEGKALWATELHPEPLTSVAYLKGITADAAGNVYVTHSSWEGSSSTENAGSVIKLDGGGREVLRIKKDIGYLLEIGISGDGSVYVTQLGDAVLRFSADGRQAGSFVAVPPRFGETWEERVTLQRKAVAATATSDLDDLLNAVVYGRWDKRAEAVKWLAARGAVAVPAVARARVRYRTSWELKQAADDVWSAHPAEAAAVFMKGDEATRRAMASGLAWAVKTPVAGLIETLSGMVKEGDEDARHALDHLGLTGEVAQFYISEYRKGLRADGNFDAQWSLTRGLAASAPALARIAFDSSDPDRVPFQKLLVEAASEYRIQARRTEDNGQETAPSALVAIVQGWLSRGPVPKDVAAIMLTAFGISGHEAAAVAAAQREPAFLVPALKALSSAARFSPNVVDGQVEALTRLLRALPKADLVVAEAFASFAKLATPGVRRACYGLLRDQSVPLEHRTSLLLTMRGESIPASELGPLLADRQWQEPLREEYFYLSFLDEVLERKDGAQREVSRDRLLEILSHPSSKAGEEADTARGQCVQALLGVLREEDGPLLDPLAAQIPQRPEIEWVVLRLAARVKPTPLLRPILEAAMAKPDSALDAALSLGRAAYPPALDIIMEQGMKRLGSYSWIQIDAGSLRPYGALAEQRLLSIMDYPNEGTRGMARILLADLGSQEGLRILKTEFAAAIEKKEMPSESTLAALLRAGFDVVPGLTDLAIAAPDAVSEVSEIAEPLIPFLEKAIVAEKVPARLKAEVLLLRQACAETADRRLGELRMKHPDPKTRALIK